MAFPMTNIPHFAKREVEKLRKMIHPIVKKASRYSLWSFPLIFVSVINLSILLFFNPIRSEMIITLLIYAVLGALGFALFKEAKHQQKELLKISTEYILGRINDSKTAPHSVKEKFTKLVRNQPAMAMQYFIEFLREEERKKFSN